MGGSCRIRGHAAAGRSRPHPVRRLRPSCRIQGRKKDPIKESPRCVSASGVIFVSITALRRRRGRIFRIPEPLHRRRGRQERQVLREREPQELPLQKPQELQQQGQQGFPLRVFPSRERQALPLQVQQALRERELQEPEQQQVQGPERRAAGERRSKRGQRCCSRQGRRSAEEPHSAEGRRSKRECRCSTGRFRLREERGRRVSLSESCQGWRRRSRERQARPTARSQRGWTG